MESFSNDKNYEAKYGNKYLQGNAIKLAYASLFVVKLKRLRE